jgi:hypothetical protein
MTRMLASAFLALASFAGVSVPAVAAGTHYRAQLVSASGESRLVVRDIVWRCGGADCVAGKSNSRPATDCAALARAAGPLVSFSAGGQALGAQELEKCNARAR